MTTKKTGDGPALTFSEVIHEPILRAASRRISVKTPEGVQEFSALEVAFRQLEKTANNGSPHAQRHLFERVQEATLAKQRKIDGEVELARQWKTHLAESRKEANERGEDPESILPCPDDIMIDSTKGFSINGPIDEKELRQTKQTMKLRDALILQEVLEQRLLANIEPDASPFGTPMVLALMLNDTLPERFRAEGHNITRAYEKWNCLTKRELLKESFQTWQNLQVRFARGHVFPDIEAIAPDLITIQRATILIQAEYDKGNSLSTKQIEDHIFNFYRDVREVSGHGPI